VTLPPISSDYRIELQLTMYLGLAGNFYFVDMRIEVQKGDSHAGDEHITYSSGNSSRGLSAVKSIQC
jgi:hypothetical protein